MLNSHVEGQNRDFFYRFNRFSYKKAYFRDFRRATLKSSKGRRLPMADLKIESFLIFKKIFKKDLFYQFS
jgi:hypothetical protein